MKKLAISAILAAASLAAIHSLRKRRSSNDDDDWNDDFSNDDDDWFNDYSNDDDSDDESVNDDEEEDENSEDDNENDDDDDDENDENDENDEDNGSDPSLLGQIAALGILALLSKVAAKKSQKHGVSCTIINCRNDNSSDDDDCDDDDCDDEGWKDDEEDYDADDVHNRKKSNRFSAEQQDQETHFVEKKTRSVSSGVKFIILLIVGAALFVSYKVYQSSKLIAVRTSSYSLIDMHYLYVSNTLKEAGFTNIRTVPLYDLSYSNRGKDGTTSEISISGDGDFSADDRYPYDTTVVIKYHSVAKEPVPVSSRKAKGSQYLDIVRQLGNAGFGNIVISVDYDLITGWINEEGEIESISINGDTSFSQGSEYLVDARIEIVYHDFKKNDPNK